MSRTTSVVSMLTHEANKVFNRPDDPPVGGVTGPLGVKPGVLVPALDNWDDCSQLFLTTGSRWRSQSFPQPDPMGACGGMYVAEFTVGVARCSQAFTEDNRLPSDEDLEREFTVQEDDKDRLEISICRAMGHLKDQGLISHFSRGPVHTQGPEGMTVAVYCTVTVAIQQMGMAGRVSLQD